MFTFLTRVFSMTFDLSLAYYFFEIESIVLFSFDFDRAFYNRRLVVNHQRKLRTSADRMLNLIKCEAVRSARRLVRMGWLSFIYTQTFFRVFICKKFKRVESHPTELIAPFHSIDKVGIKYNENQLCWNWLVSCQKLLRKNFKKVCLVKSPHKVYSHPFNGNLLQTVVCIR